MGRPKKTNGSPIPFAVMRETGDSNQREKKTGELCARPLESTPSKAMTDISKGEKKTAVGKLRIDSQRILRRPLGSAADRKTAPSPTLCINFTPKVMNRAMGIRT